MAYQSAGVSRGWGVCWPSAHLIWFLLAVIPAAAAGSKDRCAEAADGTCLHLTADSFEPPGEPTTLLQVTVNVSSSPSASSAASTHAASAAGHNATGARSQHAGKSSPFASTAASTHAAAAAGHNATGARSRHAGKVQAGRARHRQPAGQPTEEVPADLEEEVKTGAKVHALPVVGTIMAAFFAGALVNKYTNLIPESFCIVVVAVVLGVLLRYRVLSDKDMFSEYTEYNFSLMDAALMNFLLLPIIIFESGWSCSLPMFVGQFPYVIIFAVFGTVLSTVLIAESSIYLATLGVHSMVSWKANYVFAALISATDPVATLANFAQLKLSVTQPLLVALVFGESVVNDAVAIVLFSGISSWSDGETVWVPIGNMLYLFVASTLLGALLAAACVLPLKYAKFTGESHSEVFFIFMVPYLIYACADAFGLSGIIACLFAGIIFQLYGVQHMSDRGTHFTGEFLESVTRLAEGIIFILCGCCVAFIQLSDVDYCFIALALCLASRAIVVLVCGQASNALKSYSQTVEKEMISWGCQFMIWLSGLRGGVGLYLAMSISTATCSQADKTQIISATFFVVVALLLMCGSLTIPALKILGLTGDVQDGEGSPPKASSSKQLSEEIAHGRPILSGLHQSLQAVLGSSVHREEKQVT